MTNNAGFVHQGANGNAILRWWPVIVFIVVQIVGASAIAFNVESLKCEVRDIKAAMITSKEWSAVQSKRDDQISGLRNEVSAVNQRLESHMNK
jgi:hypothetical protein